MIQGAPRVSQRLAVVLPFTFFGLLLTITPSGQSTSTESAASPSMAKASRAATSDAQKIALATSAAPAKIGTNATVVEMASMKPLRQGSNEWVCYASTGEPMCLDKQWQAWAKAWMSKTEPKIQGTGIAYMLRGDKGASNTDPFATEATTDNHWVVSPAHLMLLFEDPKLLESYSTDPMNGGPWVMWKGTPYAHVMVPVSPTKSPSMPSK